MRSPCSLTQNKELKRGFQYHASLNHWLITYPSHCLHALFLLPDEFLLVLVVQLLLSEEKKNEDIIVYVAVQLSTARKTECSIYAYFKIHSHYFEHCLGIRRQNTCKF